jgi:hypothetical protein
MPVMREAGSNADDGHCQCLVTFDVDLNGVGDVNNLHSIATELLRADDKVINITVIPAVISKPPNHPN